VRRIHRCRWPGAGAIAPAAWRGLSQIQQADRDRERVRSLHVKLDQILEKSPKTLTFNNADSALLIAADF
jgi:hypothetical protein